MPAKLLILAIFYILFYIGLVRKPKMIYQKNAFNINVVKKVRVFNVYFWPFFIYGFGYLQSKLYQYRPHLFRHHKQISIKTRDSEILEIDLYEKELKKGPQQEALSKKSKPHKNKVCEKARIVHNVLLVHGFNGSSKSPYIRSLAYHLENFRVFAFNARGIRSELKKPIFFHIGWTNDIEDAVNYILKNYDGSLALVGFSMGSSWITNYLSKFDNPRIVAGIGVCVPFSFLRLRNIFKSTLKAKIFAKEFRKYLSKHNVFRRFRFNFNDVEEIDKNVTIKIFGFKNCEDYYRSESCEDRIVNIRKPMLFINSNDDPVVPYASIPIEKVKSNPNCILCIVNAGGHLGFLGGNWYKSFADNAIAEFLSDIMQV